MATRDITVRILGDAKGFTGATTVAQRALGGFGTAALASGALVGGAFIAAGVGLAKLGEQFDGAYDAIQTQTGATGEALDGLQQSFDDVLSSGPHSFENTAAAIGGLNQRLELTGDPLEALSGQFLDLSRLTETDVAGNVEAWTEAFQKFGVPAEDMGASLDAMFRASQASGIEMGVLGEQLTKFGAPLQALGFGLDESAALLAQFEESGINTSQVMRGMRAGLGKLAEEGETGAETLARVTDQIAAAGSESEATRLAVELFGSTAGPEMAAAIRSGQFDLEAMIDTMENGTSTISGTAAATDDWREKLATLKNKILVKLKPIAEKVFTAVTNAMTKVSDWIEEHWDEIEQALQNVWLWMRKNVIPIVKRVFGAVVTALGRVVKFVAENWDNVAAGIKGVFEWLMDHKPILIGVLVAIGVGLATLFGIWAAGAAAAAASTLAAAAPFIAIGAAIAALVAGVIWAYQNWEPFRKAVDTTAKFLRDVAWPIFKTVIEAILKAFKGVVKWVIDHWDDISAKVEEVIKAVVDVAKPVVEKVVGFFKAIVKWVKDHWDEISTKVEEVVGAVVDFFKDLPGNVADAFGDGWKWLREKATSVKDWISDRIDNIVSFVKGLPDRMKTAFGEGWQWLKDKARDARNWVQDRLEDVFNKVKNLPSRLANIFGEGFQWFKDKARDARNWVRDRLEDVWTRIKGLPGRMANIFGEGFQFLKDKMSSAKDWVSNRVDDVVGFFSGLAGRIKDAFGDGFSWVKDKATAAKNWVSGRVDDIVGFFSGLPGRVASALSGVAGELASNVAGVGTAIADGITSGFKSAWNAVASGINNAIPNEIEIGGWDTWFGTLPSVTINLPDNPIPTFHSGGWVDTDEQLAILQAGERVLSRREVADLDAWLAGNRGARSSGDIHFHNHNLTMTPADVSMVVQRRRASA